MVNYFGVWRDFVAHTKIGDIMGGHKKRGGGKTSWEWDIWVRRLCFILSEFFCAS